MWQMDRASILSDAITYVQHLKDHVEMLEKLDAVHELEDLKTEDDAREVPDRFPKREYWIVVMTYLITGIDVYE